MVDLDSPSLVGELLVLLLFHLQVVCRIVFYVSVCGDCLEHLDHAIPSEMDLPSSVGYLDAADGYVPAPPRIDQAVTLHPREPVPSKIIPDELEVVQGS